MGLFDEMDVWLKRIESAIDDGHGLLQRLSELEEQNSHLRAQVSEVSMRNEGITALSALYDDGFHICHANFARSREGADCLFCLSFLHREGIATKERPMDSGGEGNQ